MLGGLSASPMLNETLKQHYAAFPSLKNFISFDAGTQTAYSHVDVVNEVAPLKPYNWTATKKGEATTPIADDSVEHNEDLIAGSWGQPNLNESMWIVCGTLTHGLDDAGGSASIFGFGDSLTNVEVIFNLLGNKPYASFKGTKASGEPTNTQSEVPADILNNGALDIYMDTTETSLLCFIHRPNGGALGDATLELIAVTPSETVSLAIQEEESSGLCNMPATYSLGRTWTSNGVGAWKGLSVICDFNFNAGIPSGYLSALEQMRTDWAAGRKTLPEQFRGLL